MVPLLVVALNDRLTQMILLDWREEYVGSPLALCLAEEVHVVFRILQALTFVSEECRLTLQQGVLRALEEYGIPIDHIAGSFSIVRHELC